MSEYHRRQLLLFSKQLVFSFVFHYFSYSFLSQIYKALYPCYMAFIDIDIFCSQWVKNNHVNIFFCVDNLKVFHTWFCRSALSTKPFINVRP